MDDEQRDISGSDSDADKEYHPNTNDDAESGDDPAEPVDDAPVVSDNVPESGEEQADEEEEHEEFLDPELMDEIFARLMEVPRVRDRVYEPDEEDKQLLKK